MKLGVTSHAVVRYIERVLRHDLSELKLQYMLELGLPSLKYIKDNEFIRWVNSVIDVQPFRNQVLDVVLANLTAGQLERIESSQTKSHIVFAGAHKYIIRECMVVTIMDLEQTAEAA